MTAILVIHVAISLVAIIYGFIIMHGMIARLPMPDAHHVFLATTILTSVTGFFFPFEKLLPSHILGILSLLVLAPAVYAYYWAPPTALWRTVYAGTAMFAFYLNFFVLVVQSFLKVSGLKELAPTQSEPPFAIAQAITLVAFLVLGTFATLRYRSLLVAKPVPAAPVN